jgi:MFS transporter, SHS family, lactate transporter
MSDDDVETLRHLASSVPDVPAGEAEIVRVGDRTYRARTYLIILTTCIFLSWMLSSFDTTMVGVAGPALASAFHLAPSTMLYALTLMGLASAGAAFVIGFLIDKLGRKRMFQAVLLGVGLFSGLVAVVGAVWQFVAVRLLANFSSAGIQPAANTLLAEEAPARLRGRLQGLSVAGYALGGGAAGTISAAVLAHFSWRILFLFAFLPVLLVLVATRYLRESPRFTAARASEVRTHSGEPTMSAEGQRRSPSMVRRLFSSELRGQTLAVMTFGFFSGGLTLFVSEALPLYLTELRGLSASEAATVISLNFYALVVGDIIAATLTDCISSKWVLLGFPSISALFVIPFAFPDAGHLSLVVAMVASGLFGQASFAAWLVHVPATYPVELRGAGTGVGLAGTFVGTVVVPLLAAPLLEIRIVNLIPMLMLAVTLVMAVSALFLRRVPPRRDVDATADDVAHGRV